MPVWCRLCANAATGPHGLCDEHRLEAVRALGVCGFPRGTLLDRDRCVCGLAVRFDEDTADWFHTLEEFP